MLQNPVGSVSDDLAHRWHPAAPAGRGHPNRLLAMGTYHLEALHAHHGLLWHGFGLHRPGGPLVDVKEKVKEST